MADVVKGWCWQMFCPILILYGRCCTRMWQMLWPLSYNDRCYVLSNLVDVMPGVADEMATAVRIDYFHLSSWVLNRTSPDMCDRWCLPIFLLRDGLLTLKYIDSFIVLVRFWSSIPTILKLSTVVVWPVKVQWSNIGEMCSNPQLLQKEEHLQEVLVRCKHPMLAFKRIKINNSVQQNL